MKRRTWIGIGTAAVALVAIGAFGVWYQFFRDDAPPAVELASAVESARESAPAAAATSTAIAGAGSAQTASRQAPETWIVVADPNTFVGYRVNEVLARIGAKTAVGRTSAVTGSLRVEGLSITAVDITADMRTLRSDEEQRDRALRDQAIETDRFPTTKFVLTSPIMLQSAPGEGASFKATARGDLTLHGVTKPVEIPLEGQRISSTRAVVVGSLDLRFADFGIAQPRAFSVLSVEDHGIMELQLVLDRQG